MIVGKLRSFHLPFVSIVGVMRTSFLRTNITSGPSKRKMSVYNVPNEKEDEDIRTYSRNLRKENSMERKHTYFLKRKHTYLFFAYSASDLRNYY